MKISTVLDFIDNGNMALPEFQRGYVWNRDQVRGLMESLYRRHPVGGLLVWATESKGAETRGDGTLAPGVVKLLLDGQQRMTTLYGIVRGAPPAFFQGNPNAFAGLRFHLADERFAFYSPVKMREDPLWIDVSALMKDGDSGLGRHLATFTAQEEFAPRVGDFAGRLSRLLGIRDVDLHVEEVTGPDKTVDVVVDIFNRVNSGGTKLSKGDLALAKICADWPDARARMREILGRWREADYHFNLDWLLRNVNTIVTGEAKFIHLHDREAAEVEDGLKRAERTIDSLLNLIASRLGLDHDRVFFGRYALPVMVHYLDRRGGRLDDEVEYDKLLYWYLHAAMWGRFSGSTESVIDQDLRVLEDLDGGLDRLIQQLRLWHGSLKILPDHFGGWSLGARFYPVLYLLTRVGEARDWWFGAKHLRMGLLGKMAQLEVHHIFPKARLYEHGYSRPEVNAVANFCFLTKETNLWVSDRRPEEYFSEVEAKYPGALASQWIPMDESLWRLDRYRDFMEARRQLLAEAANAFLDELLHGEALEREEEREAAVPLTVAAAPEPIAVPGGVDSDEEEQALNAVNSWVVEQGLPEGRYLFEIADPDTGDPVAIFDLAWEIGLQEGLSEPVALLINEGPETLAAANAHGYRYFTDIESFKRYVEEDVLALEGPALEAQAS